MLQRHDNKINFEGNPEEGCRVKLVESIPEGLIYPNSTTPENPSTYSALVQLLNLAETSLELASSYWTLRSSDLDYQDPSSWQGEHIFKGIQHLAESGKVKIKIAQNLPSRKQPNRDTEDLSKVRFLRVIIITTTMLQLILKRDNT